MHAVMDGLVRPGVLGRGDGGLQIDDPRLRSHAVELGERIAPDVGEVDRPLDRSGDVLGDFHVAERRAHVGLVEVGLPRVRKDLVDAAAGHDVAAQKQRDGARPRARAFGRLGHSLRLPSSGGPRGRGEAAEQRLPGPCKEAAPLHARVSACA
jgi:hypothetical protein